MFELWRHSKTCDVIVGVRRLGKKECSTLGIATFCGNLDGLSYFLRFWVKRLPTYSRITAQSCLT